MLHLDHPSHGAERHRMHVRRDLGSESKAPGKPAEKFERRRLYPYLNSDLGRCLGI